MIQLHIYSALKGLEEKPPVGDLKKLKGVDHTYRLRIGSYSVICTFDFVPNIVDVVVIDNSGDIC